MALLNDPDNMLSAGMQRRILDEQIGLLQQGLPLAVGATLINAFLIAWIIDDIHSHTQVWGWFSLITLVSLGRLWGLRSCTARLCEMADLTRFNIGVAAAGLCWSYVSWALLPLDHPQSLVIVVMILSGICAGAVSTLSYLRTPITLFLLLVLSSLGGRFLVSGDSLHDTVAGLLSFIFMLMLGSGALRLHRSSLHAITLRLRAERHQSEMNHTLERLQEANATRNSFIANVSHELRTPLNHIIGHADMLVRRESASESVRHDGEVIRRSGQHLLLMVNDLLALAEVIDGRMAHSPGPVRMPSLMGDMVRMFSDEAHERALMFEVKMEEGLPVQVVLDEKILRQVLSSLLGNAIKFTNTGRVILHARYSPGMLHFAVSDTGSGIAPSDLDDVFEPFHKIGETMAKSAGSGIGLSLARALLSLAGGGIEVESEPGKGSTFSVQLPVSGESNERFYECQSGQEPLSAHPWQLDELTPEARLRLADLISRGRVMDILRYAESLHSELDPPPAVVGEIIRLARGLDMRGLKALLVD